MTGSLSRFREMPAKENSKSMVTSLFLQDTTVSHRWAFRSKTFAVAFSSNSFAKGWRHLTFVKTQRILHAAVDYEAFLAEVRWRYPRLTSTKQTEVIIFRNPWTSIFLEIRLSNLDPVKLSWGHAKLIYYPSRFWILKKLDNRLFIFNNRIFSDW